MTTTPKPPPQKNPTEAPKSAAEHYTQKKSLGGLQYEIEKESLRKNVGITSLRKKVEKHQEAREQKEQLKNSLVLGGSIAFLLWGRGGGLIPMRPQASS